MSLASDYTQSTADALAYAALVEQILGGANNASVSLPVSGAIPSVRKFSLDFVNSLKADVKTHVVSNIDQLKGLSKLVYRQVTTLGHTTAGDGGGTTYYLDTADTSSANNNFSVIVATDGGRWKPIFKNVVNVRAGGVFGVGDETAKINVILSAVANNTGTNRLPAVVWFPNGQYNTNGITYSGTRPIAIIGENVTGTIIKIITFTGQAVISTATGGSGVIANLTLDQNPGSYSGSSGPYTLSINGGTNWIVKNLIILDHFSSPITTNTAISGELIIEDVYARGSTSSATYAAGAFRLNGNNVKVKNLTMDGNKEYFSQSVWIVSSSNVTIEGFIVKNAAGPIVIENSSNITLKGVVFSFKDGLSDKNALNLINSSNVNVEFEDIDYNRSGNYVITIAQTSNNNIVLVKKLRRFTERFCRIYNNSRNNTVRLLDVVYEAEQNVNSRAAVIEGQTGSQLRNNVKTCGLDSISTVSGSSSYKFFPDYARMNFLWANFASYNTVEDELAPCIETVAIENGIVRLTNDKTDLVHVDSKDSSSSIPGYNQLSFLYPPDDAADGTVVNISPGVINLLTLTVKHGTGNIRLEGGTDKVLNSLYDTLALRYNAAAGLWHQLSFSNNLV